MSTKAVFITLLPMLLIPLYGCNQDSDIEKSTVLKVNMVKDVVGKPSTAQRPQGRLNTLANDLRRIFANQGHSYQRRLRDASLLIRRTCRGKEWKGVWPILRAQGLQVVESEEDQYFTRRLLLVQENAWSASDRYPHDLMIEMDVNHLGKERMDARPGEILSASEMLQATINKRYDEVLTGRYYPPGSAFDRLLRAEEVKKSASTFPFLTNIEISYDQFGYRSSPITQWGFRAVIDLEINPDEEIGGVRLHPCVASGLDPSLMRNGKDVPREAAQQGKRLSQDTLGEVEFHGMSEWWHGDPATVKRNQAKYTGSGKTKK